MLHEKVGKHGTRNRGGSKLIEALIDPANFEMSKIYQENFKS